MKRVDLRRVSDVPGVVASVRSLLMAKRPRSAAQVLEETTEGRGKVFWALTESLAKERHSRLLLDLLQATRGRYWRSQTFAMVVQTMLQSRAKAAARDSASPPPPTATTPTATTSTGPTADEALVEETLRKMAVVLRNGNPNLVLIAYTHLLTSYAARGDVASTRRLFHDMFSVGVRPDAYCASTLLNAYRRSPGASTEEVLHVVEELRSYYRVPFNEYIYSILFDLHAKSGNVSALELRMREMVAAGMSPNVQHFSSVVRAYGAVGDVDEALEALNRARELGLVDLPLFNAMIDVLAKAGGGDPAAILGLMVVMTEEYKLVPNVYTYSSLIYAFGRSFDVEGALRTWEEMKRRRVAPNLVTYSTLANVFLRAGQVDDAFRVVNQALGAGFRPDPIMTRIIVQAFALNGGVAAAIKWLKTTPILRDTAGLDALLLCYARGGDVSAAFGMMEAFLDDAAGVGGGGGGEHGFMISRDAMHALLRRAESLGSIQQGVVVMRRMRMEASLGTVAALIDACANAGETQAAATLFFSFFQEERRTETDTIEAEEEEEEDGDEESGRTRMAAAMLKVYAAEGNLVGATWLLETLGRGAGRADVLTVVRGYARAGDVEGVERLATLPAVQEQEGDGGAIASARAAAYSYAGRIDETREAVEAVRRRKGRLDIGDYNALLRVMQEEADEGVRRLAEEMSRRGCMPNVETFRILLRRKHASTKSTSRLVMKYFRNPAVYSALIRAVQEHKELQSAAMSTWRSLRGAEGGGTKEKVIVLDITTLNGLLELQVTSGAASHVVSSLLQMVRMDTTPNDKTYRALAYACERFGVHSLIQALLGDEDGDRSKKSKKPHAGTEQGGGSGGNQDVATRAMAASVLLDACVSAGRREDAACVLDELRRGRLQMTPSAWAMTSLQPVGNNLRH